MDDIFNKSILYDLYGGILSKNQQLVYEYHVNDDLSFTEIGEELGITRQAAAIDIKEKAKDNKQIINLSNKIINNIIKGGNY